MDQQEHRRATAPGDGDARARGFAAAVAGIDMAMVLTDPSQADNPIVFANAAFEALTGYSAGEFLGRNCRFLQGPGTMPEAVAAIGRAIATAEATTLEILNYRKDGSAFCNGLHITPVRGADGEVRYFFASQVDVSDHVAARAALRRQQLGGATDPQAQQALHDLARLLAEVEQRVKGNLVMISDLIQLRVRTIDDAGLSGALIDDVTGRLRGLEAADSAA